MIMAVLAACGIAAGAHERGKAAMLLVTGTTKVVKTLVASIRTKPRRSPALRVKVFHSAVGREKVGCVNCVGVLPRLKNRRVCLRCVHTQSQTRLLWLTVETALQVHKLVCAGWRPSKTAAGETLEKRRRMLLTLSPNAAGPFLQLRYAAVQCYALSK